MGQQVVIEKIPNTKLGYSIHLIAAARPGDRANRSAPRLHVLQAALSSVRYEYGTGYIESGEYGGRYR
eukprot:scaffold323630_cov37-Prasinocladus_malaysianus.AAC.1